MTLTYKTNLRCGACVQTIAPLLDGAPGIASWKADVESPDRLLTLEGDDVTRSRVDALLGKAGYQTLGEVTAAEPPPSAAPPEKTSLFPLILIVGYILGVTLLVEFASGTFDGPRAMTNFMAGFFLVFSFFKLLDLTAFADSYQMYDLLAARSRLYALTYPFIELALGIAYLVRLEPVLTNAVTLAVMLVSAVGVLRALLARRQIRCACLGGVLNLPMTYVTLAEDVLMAAMAAAMLAM